MTWAKKLGAWMPLLLLGVAQSAAAQNLDIQHGRQAPIPTGLIILEGARAQGVNDVTIGAQLTYMDMPLSLRDAGKIDAVVSNQLALIPTVSWGISSWAGLSASWLLGVEGLQAQWNGSGFVKRSSTVGGLGDIWLQGHFAVLTQAEHLINFAIAPVLRIASLSGHYFSDGTIALVPELLIDRTFGPLFVGLNLGAVLRIPRTEVGLNLGEQFLWRVGAGYSLTAVGLSNLQATLEAFGLANPQAPAEWLAGARFRHGHLLLSGGVGTGLSGGYGAPRFRATVSVAWSTPPNTAPVIPPPPPDADEDGVPDARDACPAQHEDHLAPDPNDGCPTPVVDRDNDGIADPNDACPDIPADPNHGADSNGCPTADRDGDGIPDYLDQCPDEPKEHGKGIDPNGCPWPDKDQDGIPDKDDKCPDKPEVVNGVDDTDGCPDENLVELKEESIELKGNVYFGVGTDVLLRRGFELLNQLATLLNTHPSVHIRIEGYTDDVGGAARNKHLSTKRAESVKRYLIGKGVDAGRLEAVGYGSSKPRMPNNDPRSRALNRRVTISVVPKENAPAGAAKPKAAAPAPPSAPAP